MISYIMLGTNDLDKAVNFFDIILHPLGLHRVELDRDYAGYAEKKRGSEIEFYVTKPFNGETASVGNGSMVSFLVGSKNQVDLFHEIALKNGAENEGNPGPRPPEGDMYYCYIRDLDGNKICVCSKI